MQVEISNILLLRPLNTSDAQNLTKYANNINIWKNLTDMFPHPYSENDAIWFIDSQKNILPAKVFAIIYVTELIGTIGIETTKVNNIVDIGYWIGEAFWNKGIASLIIPKFCEYCFNNFKEIDTIIGKVYPENIASAKVLEKCNFKKDIYLKNAIIKNGKSKDFQTFKLIKEL